MKIVTIRKDLLQLYSIDAEMLRKTNRPCVMIVKLKYKGQNYDFAVPFRSNIPASTPKEQYFALPPRTATRPKNRHGLHYIKMFPVTKEYLVRYRTEGNEAAQLYKRIIDANEKRIVTECQLYLDRYTQNGKAQFATDIDLLLERLKNK